MKTEKEQLGKYILKSNFASILKTEIHRRNITGRKKTTYTDLYEEIAEHTGMTPNMLMVMKQGNANPSLPNALAIADYLRMDVNDIWSVEMNDEYNDDRSRCIVNRCNRLEFVKGLCQSHYTEQRREEKRK